jgi:hypothetical protein
VSNLPPTEDSVTGALFNGKIPPWNVAHVCWWNNRSNHNHTLLFVLTITSLSSYIIGMTRNMRVSWPTLRKVGELCWFMRWFVDCTVYWNRIKRCAYVSTYYFITNGMMFCLSTCNQVVKGKEKISVSLWNVQSRITKCDILAVPTINIITVTFAIKICTCSIVLQIE